MAVQQTNATAETPNRPWLRRIRVTLGPLEEYKNAKKGSTVQFVSDGTLNGLRVVASIQKTIMVLPQPSMIDIYNLSRDTRNAIKKSLTKITLEAGWGNTDYRTVFQGSVVSVVSEKAGADIVTHIMCLPGYGAVAQAASSATFGPATPITTVIEQLGKDLPGVVVDQNNFRGCEGRIGGRGWSCHGTTKQALTDLAEEYGFSWSINDGKLVCIGDRFMLAPSYTFDSVKSGLVSITPILSGPFQITTGVRIKALYIPGLSVGSSIKVDSKLNEQFSGTYRIHTCSISIDAYSDSWTMDLENYMLGIKV